MANRIKLIEVVEREGVHNVVIVSHGDQKPKFCFRSNHRHEALNVAKAYARQWGVLIHYSTDTRVFDDGVPIGTPDDPNNDPVES